jgi:DNA-binding transcriptional LysR family regulator
VVDKFLEMRAFAAVVEAGSFVHGASSLGLSKQAASRLISELETRLGVRLLLRTTRRLSLTDEGQIFYARCAEVLAEIEGAEAEVTSRAHEATGVLRINAPLSFGMLHLADLWPVFMREHPKLSLDVALSDRVVDLVEEGFDLAVRIASLPGSSLVSRRLSSTRVICCASPGYLKRKKAPKHPSELAEHDVLAYSLLATGDQWEFWGDEGRVTVKVHPRLRSTSGDTCRAAALQDHGIIVQPSFMVGEDLKAGRLVEVLPNFRCIELGIYAVYPARKLLPPKVRLMVDFLASALTDRAWC